MKEHRQLDGLGKILVLGIAPVAIPDEIGPGGQPISRFDNANRVDARGLELGLDSQTYGAVAAYASLFRIDFSH